MTQEYPGTSLRPATLCGKDGTPCAKVGCPAAHFRSGRWKGKVVTVLTCDYNGWNDAPEEEREWFDEHPEVLLTVDLKPEESMAGVLQLLKLKPAENGETGRKNKQGVDVIRFHGLLNAAPDPLEPDPEFQIHSYQLMHTLELGGRVLLPGTNMSFNALQLEKIEPARGGEFAQWLVGRLAAEPGTKMSGSRGMRG